MAATGSVLTNKYSEVTRTGVTTAATWSSDEIEDEARRRVCALFGADHANVQPHAGRSPTWPVYQAVLEPGDTVLGMSLDHVGI